MCWARVAQWWLVMLRWKSWKIEWQKTDFKILQRQTVEEKRTWTHTHTHCWNTHSICIYILLYISIYLSLSLSVINSLLGFCFSTPWASLGIQQTCLTRPGECVNDSGQPIHAMLADAFGPIFVFPYAPQPYWWHLRFGQQSLNGGTPPCWMQVSLRFQMLLPVIVAALKALIILGLSALTHIACWLNQLHSSFVVLDKSPNLTIILSFVV